MEKENEKGGEKEKDNTLLLQFFHESFPLPPSVGAKIVMESCPPSSGGDFLVQQCLPKTVSFPHSLFSHCSDVHNGLIWNTVLYTHSLTHSHKEEFSPLPIWVDCYSFLLLRRPCSYSFSLLPPAVVQRCRTHMQIHSGLEKICKWVPVFRPFFPLQCPFAWWEKAKNKRGRRCRVFAGRICNFISSLPSQNRPPDERNGRIH